MHNKLIPILLKLSIMLLVATTASSTILSGSLDGVIFTPSSNPYIIEKDLTVPAGAVVVIPPGCVFLFSPFSGITVNGSLYVIGTVDSPVVFTSINDTSCNHNSMRRAEPFDWNGILLGYNAASVQMHNIVLSYSAFGICSHKDDFTIDNVVFHSNGQYNITIRDSILDVRDRVPFSYTQSNLPAAIQLPDNRPLLEPQHIPDQSFSARIIPIIKTDKCRYVALSLAIAGAAAGIGLSFQAYRHHTVLEDISSGAVARDPTIWNREREAKWRMTNGTIVAFGVCLLGGMFVTIGLF